MAKKPNDGSQGMRSSFRVWIDAALLLLGDQTSNDVWSGDNYET